MTDGPSGLNFFDLKDYLRIFTGYVEQEARYDTRRVFLLASFALGLADDGPDAALGG